MTEVEYAEAWKASRMTERNWTGVVGFNVQPKPSRYTGTIRKMLEWVDGGDTYVSTLMQLDGIAPHDARKAIDEIRVKGLLETVEWVKGKGDRLRWTEAADEWLDDDHQLGLF